MVYVAPSIWKVALLHFLKIFPLTNCRVALPWVAGFELISRRTVALVSNRFLNSSNDRSLDRSGVLSLSLRTCPHTCPVGMFDSADFLSIVFSFITHSFTISMDIMSLLLQMSGYQEQFVHCLVLKRNNVMGVLCGR